VKQHRDLDPTFIKGDHGILEVIIDGKVVWSNRTRLGYKPSDEEFTSALLKSLQF
jgi:hypothetical protein